MDLRVVVLGAGFGGLELSSMLSEALGDRVDLTLIDKSESFSFGFSKLDVMFGYKTADSVRLAYRNIAKPGVRFVRKRSQRSTPMSAASLPTKALITRTYWWWHWVQTTI